MPQDALCKLTMHIAQDNTEISVMGLSDHVSSVCMDFTNGTAFSFAEHDLLMKGITAYGPATFNIHTFYRQYAHASLTGFKSDDSCRCKHQSMQGSALQRSKGLKCGLHMLRMPQYQVVPYLDPQNLQWPPDKDAQIGHDGSRHKSTKATFLRGLSSNVIGLEACSAIPC